MSYDFYDKVLMFYEFEKYLFGSNPGHPVKRPDSVSQNKPGTNTNRSHEEGVKANTDPPPVAAVLPDTPLPPAPGRVQPDPPTSRTPPVEVKTVKESHPDTPAAPASVTSPKPPSVRGITLAKLAEKVRLPVEHLKLVGLKEIDCGGRIAVKCPYLLNYFDCAAVRYVRSAWSRIPGQLFTWERGPAPALVYGLDWLDARRRDSKWVLLVTGELNCWVAWYYRLPVVALPEQSVWTSEWAELFDGLEVYLWRSPSASTELEKRIAVDIPDLRVIIAPAGIKDLNAAYRKGKYLPTYLADLKKKSISLAKTTEQKAADLREALHTKARPVIEAPDPLEIVKQAFTGLGYGGDVKLPLIVYLAMTARVLEVRDGEILPHLLLHGSSSSGKSFIVNMVKKMMPAEAYHVIDASSVKAFIYDPTPLEHKLLIFSEADSLPSREKTASASAMRNLLADNYLHYTFTSPDRRRGGMSTREIVKHGPTVLVTTWTKLPGPEMLTRLLILEMHDDPAQIAASLRAQANLEIGAKAPVAPPELVAFQQYLQTLAPIKVIVPFAPVLGDLMGRNTSSSRVRRDFGKLLSLIKPVAIIRAYHRQRDNLGRIIADIADYATVRDLTNDVFKENSSPVEDDVRQLVNAVAAMGTVNPDQVISITAMAEHLNTYPMNISRLAKRAIESGWLINVNNQRGRPAQLKILNALPVEVGLPPVDEINRLYD